MSQSAVTELRLPYDPGPLTAKVERRRRVVRGRIVSLVITVVILVAIYFWQRDELEGTAFIPVYAVVLGIPIVWLAVVVIQYRQTRGQLRSMGYGTAIRVGPPGIQVAGLAASWPYVGSVAVTKGRLGRSPALTLRLIDGRQSQVPLDQVTVFPATLDGSVRAFSAGRQRVDLSALEN
ncbi:MAG TPA: hypothetical protein VLJ88_09825 [Propionibacteriaceae bacterium]|nr:hypothetical protein [Propionibacteriaceae bacterium]